MNDSASGSQTNDFEKTALDALRLGSILLIVFWCYKILAPFMPLVVWGAIIAVAAYPLHLKLLAQLGNRNKTSASLITLLGILVLTAPVIVLSESLIQSSMDLAERIEDGSVQVAPPPEQVQDFPLVGDEIHSGWLLASRNMDAALTRFNPQLEAVRHRLITVARGAGAAFLQLLFSMIVAGVFLATAKGSVAGTQVVVNKLVGDHGPLLLKMSETTIRSVARGVLGVAIIESILASIGMLVAGVPATGFWTFVILVLSIIQVPPLLVLIPMIFYVISSAELFGAIVFVILTILVILVDTFLKPVLLGRTVDAPMLVILMGAIGGMMLMGIVGLFVGAVVLMVGWELLEFWLGEGEAG